MMKIGFCDVSGKHSDSVGVPEKAPCAAVARKSVVRVFFEDKNKELSYYNDCFDLQVGNFVFVEGALENTIGRITEVNYNFKIKLSDYKRVISVADTDVHGTFYNADSHFVAFSPNALPKAQIRGWFLPPVGEEDFVSGSDGESFPLNDLKKMGVTPQIAERGHQYYLQNRVVYLSLNGSHGYAIVSGSQMYEVEFEYRDGLVSGLVCTCFCTYPCKHEFAVMLQLREILDIISENYAELYNESDGFAAILKSELITFAVDGKKDSHITL